MLDLTLIPASGATFPETRVNRHWSAGEFISGSKAQSERISPSHRTVVSRASIGTIQDAEAPRAAFDDGRWSQLSGKARATVLLRVADLIEANADRMALIETLESGKPITQARGEVSGAADLCNAASLARALHGDSHNSLGSDMLAIVLKEPVGVVSIITRSNFPFWILNQKLPFALAAE